MSNYQAIWEKSHGALKGILPKVTQGGTLETITILALYRDGTNVDLSAMTITGQARNNDNAEVTSLTGTFTGADGSFTWEFSAGDVGTAGDYSVIFTYTDGSDSWSSDDARFTVKANPAATAVQNAALVGVSATEAAWLTTAADAGALGTAAYSATGDFDADGDADAAQTAAEATSLAQLLTYPTIETAITKPDGFYFNPPFTIIKSGSTFYPINGGVKYDVRQNFVEGDGVYYVDVNTGSDSNAGTPQAPLKSLNAAIDKIDATTIYVAPGHYDRVTGGVDGGEYNKSINIIKNGEGDVYISRRQSGLSWTLDGTYTNCYTSSRSLTLTVIDESTTDVDGDLSELTKATSEANCNSTPGSWYIDGANKVYVRTFDDRSPDSDVWVLVAENILRFAGDYMLYLEGLTIVGGASSSGGLWHQSAGAGQRPKVYAKDCKFIYGGGNGVFLEGVALAVFQGCQCRKNKADGFNYQTQDSIIPVAIEINCTGFKNGTDDASDNDNGSSVHAGGSAIRLNGSYTENWGPNVIDIDTAESWNLGCTASDSQSTTNAYGFYITGKMWIDSCTAENNAQTDLNASSGSTLNYRNSTYNTSGGAGTVQSY